MTVTEALSGPFEPPPYPYDRLNRLKPLCEAFDGGLVDLSIGTPFDAPPESVIQALASSGTERSYPASAGTPEYRTACANWMRRRLGVDVPIDQVAAAVGTKEFVASLPGLLKLMTPTRDTVLYPAIAYPSYAMGATLGGCRSVGVPFASDGTLDLAAIDQDDIDRALLLWVNSPGNPTGHLDDLGAAAMWGRYTASRCFLTSATSNSPGTDRRRRFWNTGSTASLRCTRSRSDRTSPERESASMPATARSSNSSAAFASTAG